MAGISCGSLGIITLPLGPWAMSAYAMHFFHLRVPPSHFIPMLLLCGDQFPSPTGTENISSSELTVLTRSLLLVQYL